jgi:hypothetical protein
MAFLKVRGLLSKGFLLAIRGVVMGMTQFLNPFIINGSMF